MGSPKSDEPQPVDEGVLDGQRVFVTYEVLGDWHVTLIAQMYAPIDGPIEMSIKLFERAGAWKNPAVADGLTVHVLRAIPMRSARKRLQSIAIDAYRGAGDMASFPKRFTSEEDFARLAELFVTMADKGDPNPIRAIAVEYGKPRNTVAVRVNRARSLGLLTPEGKKPKLTARAERILGLERTNG